MYETHRLTVKGREGSQGTFGAVRLKMIFRFQARQEQGFSIVKRITGNGCATEPEMSAHLVDTIG